MEINKIGTHVKRNLNSILNTFLGAIKFKHTLSTRKTKLKPTENTSPLNQMKKNLLESEYKKSQALMFAHKIQNR